MKPEKVMNKPKITEGEWGLQDSTSMDWGKGIGVMAKTHGRKSGVAPVIFTQEDAQAISAVPNLIKIGVKILHKLQSETESVTALDQFELESALKKAGCV